MTPDKAIEFIQRLRYPIGVDGAGGRVRLLEWQKEIIARILSAENPIKELSLWLGRGSGKTTFVSLLVVLFLFSRKNQNIVITSNTIEESSVMYSFVRSIIEQDSWLHDRCRIYGGQAGNVKRIECHLTNSTFVVQSYGNKGKLGGNTSIYIAEECGFYDDRTTYERITTSMGKRTSGDTLIMNLSTAGDDTESFGYELFQKAKQHAENPSLDPSFLPIIYQGNPDKWDDISEWEKANPSLKELANYDYVRRKIESAKANPSEIPGLVRFHLNCWITGDESPWISAEKWDACAEKMAIPERAEVWIGIDIGSTSDMSAVCILAKVGDKYIIQPYYFTPKDTLDDRERKHKAPYRSWERQKLLTTVDGDCLDSSSIVELLRELRKKYQIRDVGIDRYFQSNDLAIALQSEGFPVTMVGAGARTIVPVAREFENLVMQKRLIHNQHPILRWNLLNCRAYIADDLGNMSISKKRSRGKIDGIFATFYALAREMEKRSKGGGSIGFARF